MLIPSLAGFCLASTYLVFKHTPPYTPSAMAVRPNFAEALKVVSTMMSEDLDEYFGHTGMPSYHIETVPNGD